MSIQQVATERASTVIAAGMASSPWWLPWLKSASEIAGYLVPIVGLVWLTIQILAWLYKQAR